MSDSNNTPPGLAANSPARASPLGRSVAPSAHYAPALLFPVLRRDKRLEIGIADGAALPFFGEDLWNGYELSWLNPRGKPVVALIEFRLPAASPCLIESKSIKLYLNSFSQTVVASGDDVERMIAGDLEAVAGAPVAVRVVPLSAGPLRPQRRFASPARCARAASWSRWCFSPTTTASSPTCSRTATSRCSTGFSSGRATSGF